MRKRIVDFPRAEAPRDSEQGRLDLEQTATVEVTSEDPDYPVESVFSRGRHRGWRASGPGEQRIRRIFDHPIPLRRIQLHFHEPVIERTQEFTLRWSSANGGAWREIVRQQWNFSPAGSTSEVEDYWVNLADVTV
jgi:hypothetical protein